MELKNNINNLLKPKSKEEVLKLLHLNPTNRNYIFISKLNKNKNFNVFKS